MINDIFVAVTSSPDRNSVASTACFSTLSFQMDCRCDREDVDHFH